MALCWLLTQRCLLTNSDLPHFPLESRPFSLENVEPWTASCFCQLETMVVERGETWGEGYLGYQTLFSIRRVGKIQPSLPLSTTRRSGVVYLNQSTLPVVLCRHHR
jgi:hypothetical protein